jgi:hypothetical protein
MRQFIAEKLRAGDHAYFWWYSCACAGGLAVFELYVRASFLKLYVRVPWNEKWLANTCAKYPFLGALRGEAFI